MNITFKEYQEGVARTSALKDGPQDRRMYMTGMGIVGEVGELCDQCKKVIFHSHPTDLDKLDKEMGDVLYYIAEGCNAHDVCLKDVIDREFDQFEQHVEKSFRGLDQNKALLERCLRLGSLAGDYSDYVHDRLVLGQPPMPAGPEILGEILDELAHLGDILGLHITDVAIHNAEKLRLRYPNGFESNRSINRQENSRG